MDYTYVVHSSYEQSVCQKGVETANTRNCAQVSEELLERYRHDPAKNYFITRYSG